MFKMSKLQGCNICIITSAFFQLAAGFSSARPPRLALLWLLLSPANFLFIIFFQFFFIYPYQYSSLPKLYRTQVIMSYQLTLEILKRVIFNRRLLSSNPPEVKFQPYGRLKSNT